LQTSSLATHAFTLWLTTALLIQSRAGRGLVFAYGVDWRPNTRVSMPYTMRFPDSQTLFVREDPVTNASWTCSFHVSAEMLAASGACRLSTRGTQTHIHVCCVKIVQNTQSLRHSALQSDVLVLNAMPRRACNERGMRETKFAVCRNYHRLRHVKRLATNW